MFPNESKSPLTTSLAVYVSRLGPSWRFYAKLLGLEVVGSVGRPVHSLFLSMPDASDQEIKLPEGGESDSFILRLTTQPLERSVERIRIELESVHDLVRIWMLAKMMRFPNSGLRVKGAKYSMIVRDPDWHPIELCATEGTDAPESDEASAFQSDSSDHHFSESIFDDHALNGVLGGLFRSGTNAPNSGVVNKPTFFSNHLTDHDKPDWD